MKSCCTYCANRSYFVHKSVQQLRIFQGVVFYCSVLLQIVQNLTVLYGVLCNILKDPFKSASEMQMVTRNFGLMFAAPSLRRTLGTFLKILWTKRMLHLMADGHGREASLADGPSSSSIIFSRRCLVSSSETAQRTSTQNCGSPSAFQTQI